MTENLDVTLRAAEQAHKDMGYALNQLRREIDKLRMLDGIGIRSWPTERAFGTRFFSATLNRGAGPFPIEVEYSLEERGTLVCIWTAWVTPEEADDWQMDIKLTDAEDQRISEEIAARPETWELDYDD